MSTLNRQQSVDWFTNLRDMICSEFEKIELEYGSSVKFKRSPWERKSGGGGVMSIMHGQVFEKVGVNISTVFGEFSEEFRKQIPGTEENSQFFATGISVVAHTKSPLVPAVHFNTRYIETSKHWFGGGSDLTPYYPSREETKKFHQAFKQTCDKYNPGYYPKFKQQCDEYFYLPHRKESRGIGGIFYDYFNSGDFISDLLFTKDIGKTFLEIYPTIVRAKMAMPWTQEQKKHQLIRRGRYVEFNLLHDRGTKFGLMTDGNVDAILMSMPPEARWE